MATTESSDPGGDIPDITEIPVISQPTEPNGKYHLSSAGLEVTVIALREAAEWRKMLPKTK